ncbi:MAG: DUF6119 family protein [Pseudorhodoplanes sp.]|uniref:DUF6119 family protein n=1 Tax=Pseudorhodoplanes sp. TaxID=1934341 RepID=UPI003D0B2D7F
MTIAVATIKSMTLSVRLLRQNRTVETALREDHELDEIETETGRLFVGQAPSTPPTWASFIGQFARASVPRLANQSCGAVLFLDVTTDDTPPIKRVMALTFGTGHHSLDLDAFERGFGLRVVLNSVARSNLRSLDIATLDATTFLRRIQASRDADLQGFGVDTDRDLLTLAAGSPRDASFARSLAGRDALTLNTKTSPVDVMEKCKKALTLYQAQDYKTDYGFIDYVSPVRRRDLWEQLDALAFAELGSIVNGGSSDLHIALPDILDPEEGIEIGFYGVGFRSGAKPAHYELAIEDYVAELKAGDFSQVADMATLRSSHEVRVIIDGEGDKKRKRKIYDCLVFEVEHQGTIYVLFGGAWYAIDKIFHATVEAGFAKLVSTKPFVTSTTTANEREFIVELDASKNLLNMDQVKLNPAGMGGANLEPCDFLSTARQFIHLKDGHDSAPISHLWNQGVVSAEAFVRDEKFRKDFRAAAQRRQKKAKKTGFEKLLPDGRSKPTPSDFTVVYGIMRSRYRKSGSLGLPFFSKISLRAIADRIELMGYTVEVHLIEKLTAKTASKPVAKAT